jgi:hypothetical protein
MNLRLSMSVFLIGVAALAEEPRRIAVIVGANRGALGRESLRYSYRDAHDVAQVLVQTGQFAPADVHVLDDPEPDAVIALLDLHLAALAATTGESLLLFYYSGHADAGALYPAGKPLPFGSLRARLDNRAATVRLGIIDACSGGGWTGAKGLHAAPPFAVDVPLELSGEGSVLIASSSGVEKAHESERLLGSFFTHHLVAGLRGAADPRGDGVVTVGDAFAYAKERTIRDTAAVSTEPQHPSFFMNLRGRADLPLARVDSSPTVVELQEKEGPLQVIHLGTGVVLLEIPAGQRTIKLSVPPGHYLVRRRTENGTWTGEIGVESGRTIIVREQDLALSGYAPAAGKGLPEPQPSNTWPLALNDRPLTLHRGLAQVDVGALLAQSPRPLNHAFAIAPLMRYGLTDRATFSLGAPGGLCVGNYHYTNPSYTNSGGNRSYNACQNFSAGLNAGLSYLLDPLGPLELATNFSVGYQDGPIPLIAGFSARIGGGGPLALVLSPGVRYLDQRSACCVSQVSFGATAQLILQFREKLALELRATEPFEAPAVLGYYPWSGSSFLEDWRPVSVALGATYAVSRHLDLRGEIAILNVTGNASPPGDYRTFGLSVSVRP